MTTIVCPAYSATLTPEDESQFHDSSHFSNIGWLVGCFGLNDSLRHYFSLYRAISQREGERGEKR